MKKIWLSAIGEEYPLKYEIYEVNNNFYFKVLIYKKRKPIKWLVDLNTNKPIENLKNDKNYLKIQEEFKSWGDSQVVLKIIKDFNFIIDYIINNF